MDNTALIQAFVDSVIAHRTTLLSNPDLRVEPIAQSLQLLAKTEGLVATAKPMGKVQMISVRSKSVYWPKLHDTLMQVNFLPAQQSTMAGFYEYHLVEVPEGYEVNFTDSLDMLQAWWSYTKKGKPQDLMEMLVFHRSLWYPIRALNCDRGTLQIETLGHPIELYPLDKLVWLQRQHPPQPQQSSAPADPPLSSSAAQQQSKQTVVQMEPPAPSPSTTAASAQHNGHCGNGHRVKGYPSTTILPPSTIKQIGSYLVEAGLLSAAQVELALHDQERTGMRFGEILVRRGWLKQQTIEFLMQEVILPHRAAAKQEAELTKRRLVKRLEQVNLPQQPQKQVASIHERETLVTQDPLELEDF